MYKERGVSSHHVVSAVRSMFRPNYGKIKVGHTGTLDLEAEGVLPVCVGKATKLSDMITSASKIYRAELILGITTDTEDIHGAVLSKQDVNLSETDIRTAILFFVGRYLQTPPMYSAIKYKGQPLYKIARQGYVIDRSDRAKVIEIYSIDVISISKNIVLMDVHCSKGSYIRTLCADIGKNLGCGACMGRLIRL